MSGRVQLEDHAGDVLRKAREAAGLPLEQAARALHLSSEDYLKLEEEGYLPITLADSTPLLNAVGLKPEKWIRLASGWLPPPISWDTWREIRIITSEQENLQVHAYLIWDEVTREAALFDTGWTVDEVCRLIREHQLSLQHVFLTHSHDDHMAALGPLRQQFPKSKLHTSSPHAPPQHRNRPQDFVHLGSLRITNRPLPGHAPDGVIYLVGNWPEDAPHVAFLGDTLFAGSLATGFVSWDQLRDGVREQILSLPDDTLLCPGHGPATTVLAEKQSNPFF